MKNQSQPNKPPEKRGVNKATMDAPQEEFVDDQRASSERPSQPPETTKVAPDDSDSGES